jgi:hypothetical protein
MPLMNLQKIWVPLAGIVLLIAAYVNFGWPGIALVGGGIVMYLLLFFSRAIAILKRAADRPMGYVESAVMLNAKLKKGVNLMHVMAMTRALGELRSLKDAQPELYRWTDGSKSFVDAEFRDGKLVEWTLTRPAVTDEPAVLPESL